MRMVVTGASGNVGTSVLEAVDEDPDAISVTGLARRIGDRMPFPEVNWIRADVATTPLEPLFEGADAVIHLAWAIQPSRNEAALWRTNVLGSRRVFEAAAATGVRSLVYASSIGAYSPGPYEPRVVEEAPVDGIATSFYSRHKATVEWILDRVADLHPQMSVARVRPALIFKREAASGIRRLFLGRFFPTRLLSDGTLPFLPLPSSLRFQAVHSMDVARACVTLAKAARPGTFNLAAEPVIDTSTFADLLGTRLVHMPVPVLRSAAAVSWRLRSQPTPEGWLDMATDIPLMDTSHARRELGWEPTVDAKRALADLISGLVDKASLPTPALSRYGRPVPKLAAPVEP